MFIILALLFLAHKIPCGGSLFHPCIPLTKFHVNGRLCTCDAMGRWSETSCEVSQRQTCKPGQIVWEGCNQCICQENGNMLCNNNMCTHDTPSITSQIGRMIDLKKLWCIPFMSYYVNCSLCVCPVSGKMKDARCAADATCPFVRTTDYMAAINNNVCIPKVLYLFPCLICLCSDEGFFDFRKCVEDCQLTVTDVSRRCVPKTFYRKDCNICFCPSNGITNNKLCTISACNHPIALEPLFSLMNKTRKCQRQTFTGKKCFYCECTQGGLINEKLCLESECMSIDDFEYNFHKISCSIGEMLPKCMECLCLKNGTTEPRYCTKECGDDHRLLVLDDAVKDSFNYHHVLDRNSVQKTETKEICKPNTIYKEEGRYCLCPDNGNTNFKLCTSMIVERSVEKKKIKILGSTVVDIDFNVKCEPKTFVEFDCNTCYCMKTGRIDPKWCTYDDCKSKRLVMDEQKHEKRDSSPVHGKCTPGSISREECNFCICPDNGQLKDRACTKNKCAVSSTKVNYALLCEPLTYYTVDCNICYCPKTGVKNVAKCTKNTCEKTFLRSEVCVPGRLFSEECNVCVCPSNGDKADKVCTNNTCNDSDTPWKKIFQLSHSLMSYQKLGETTRNLELCFPGEEFEMGCKVCLCPDMGLRVYATCTQMLCDEERNAKEIAGVAEKPDVQRTRRSYQGSVDCLNLHDANEPLKNCTPGSIYIIKCQECICPYSGNIAKFCRPLPEKMSCEQAYPGINYLIGRRDRTGEVFNVDCNTCQCDDEGLVYCTVKNCLKDNVKSKDDIDEAEFRFVEAPLNDLVCDPGTKYKKDCNTCYCFKTFGVKKFACTVEKCSSTDMLRRGCVEGSVYEMNCLKCLCGVYNGKKMEICEKNPKCKKDSEDFSSVANWVGYCEPMHRFMKDCNPCECLADGRTARCLANSCTKTPEVGNKAFPKPIAVEIVPIVKDIGSCERGATFRIDCNMCFCLMNGDVVCTTEDCGKSN